MLQISYRSRFWQSLKLVFFSFIFVSCNSLFYYPDAHIYGDIKSLDYKKSIEEVATPNGNFLEIVRLEAIGKPEGTVVHFHGNAQNLTAHLAFSYWLPENGFNLVIFDYEGYGKSTGKASRENTIRDGLVALRYAKEKSPDLPLFVFGQSLGGAIGYVSAALSGYDICGVAIESSFASYSDIAQSKLAQNWFSWPVQWLAKILVSDELSPHLYSSKNNFPTYFIHGNRDKTVPFAEGIRFYNIHKGPKQWSTVENGGHTSAFSMDSLSFRSELVKFFSDLAASCKKNRGIPKQHLPQ